jgi:hypothetical protein
MNAITTLNQLPSTLDQISQFVKKVKDEALSGEYNILEILIQLRAAQQAIEILNKDEEIMESAIDEYSKHSEKTVDFGGVKITQKETGVKYEYEVSGDYKWELYKSTESQYAGLRKEREKFLQTVKESFTIINEETGEIETINPVPKTSKTTLAVTLK